MVKVGTSTMHSALQERFKEEHVFVEVIDTLLGLTGASLESEKKCAAHKSEGYFMEGGKLWHVRGANTNSFCVTP